MNNGEKLAFLPGGKHVSSSIGRFVNYFGPKPDAQAALQSCEAVTNEPMVIIDGSDDWGSPAGKRPQIFVPADMIFAWFHTGTSGMTMSGVVVRKADFGMIEVMHAQKYPRKDWDSLKIISRED